MRKLLATLLVLAVCRGARAAGDEVPVHRYGSMSMRAQKIWEHPQQDNWIGGLTMIAAENSWPLVFQYPFFGSYPFAGGNGLQEDVRNLWPDVQWGYVTPVDLELEDLAAADQGAGRPVLLRHVLSAASLKTVEDKRRVGKDWVHIRYRYTYQKDKILEAVYSRLCPAFLFSVSGERLRLFAFNRVSFQLSGRPDKEVGGCNWPRLTRALVKYMDGHRGEYRPYQVRKNLVPHVAYGGSTIDYVTFNLRPTAVAFAAKDGVEVRGGNVDIEGKEMAEPWLLVWHGGGSPLYATTLTGFFSRSMRPIAPHFGLHQMDCPFLVVLEKKPRNVALDPDGMLLNYEDEGGRVVLMPLRGVNYYEAEETEAWRTDGAIPREIVERCRFWTSCLLEFPLTVSETARANAEDGSVTMHDKFGYESLKDEWGFPHKKTAPVPPMAATALSFGFPVRFDEDPLDAGLFTKFGKYMLFEDQSEHSYRIEDMSKYLDMRVRLRSPESDTEKALVEKVRREAEIMAESGHLAPFFTFNLSYLHQSTHWDFPGDLLCSVAGIADVLPAETKAKLKAYLRKEMEDYPPLAGERFPPDEGRFRALYPVPEGRAGDFVGYERSYLQMFSKSPQQLYHLWLYAEKFDDWDHIESNWDEISYYFRIGLRTVDWTTSFFGALRCQAPNLGFMLGIHDINNFIAGAIGYTRMAEKLGKKEDAAFGRVFAAKWLMTRFVYCKFEESLLAEGVARQSPSVRLSNDWWRDNIVNMVGVQQVYTMTQFGVMLDRTGQGYGKPRGRFKNLTPEVACFLKDHNGESEKRAVSGIMAQDDLWYLSGGVLPPACDRSNENIVAASYFLDSPADLVKFVGEPDCIGDLYFFQKAAAVLRASEPGN